MKDKLLRDVICRKCDFYKEGEELECYAFKLSKKLLREGKITIDELKLDEPNAPKVKR